MKDIVLYTVVPQLPSRLSPLIELARNLWFSWNLHVIDLFRSIDQTLWEDTGHNPWAMLGRLGQERITELSHDEGFLQEMDRIHADFSRYRDDRRIYDFDLENPVDFKVAYLSAEFGLTDCLPIYSGGLGVLAGDFLKSASDLRFPMVGVGLFYQKGYFRQYMNADGWQQETYPDNDFHNLPVVLERDPDGSPVDIEVPIQNRSVRVRIWRIQVGRVPLFMLDTNTVENREDDRNITSALYGGDKEMRLRQEIVLGIGGVRALNRLKIQASVFHMNEGHSALANLERIRVLMEERRLSFAQAREAAYSSSVFTTHTPVPAGIDVFDNSLIRSYLGPYLQKAGVSADELLALGSIGGNGNEFNTAVFALRTSSRTNAVSELHRTVSRRMWQELWPGLPEADIPITHVTNGIHIPSYLSDDFSALYDRYLGRRWAEDPDNVAVWTRVNRIPDAELWRSHERRRERLVTFTRRRLEEQIRRRGGHAEEIQGAAQVLNPEALTVGFARRFATYKRGDLILRDPARLSKILNDAQRPVQIIFAGKAHPQDNLGKEVIKRIIHLAHQPEFRDRIVLVEDYDLAVARYMVQGCDIWLNTPRRPMEACGTSGMKAAANGALNMSILDGWWAEGHQPGLGWAIGSGEEYDNPDVQDFVESQAIYDLLERYAVPLFYQRGRDNVPREWIGMMKNSLLNLVARFNSHRMLQDYIQQLYLPSALNWKKMEAENFKAARDFQAWIGRVRERWPQIRILEKRADTRTPLQFGGALKVDVHLQLGGLSPQDLAVHLYYGPVDSKAELLDRETIRLSGSSQESGRTVFRGEIPCRSVGRFGFRVRVLPYHPLLANPHSLGLILWG
ncbi:MAG TPA: alpha-glucan family phosphorylase [Thermodesulfobacteriota bacterium]|nr:alpha-glucan family phosphorylase [Thermodesulfobacteriota bacterium]